MNIDINVLKARYVLGQATPEQIVATADDLLNEGVYSDSLAQLLVAPTSRDEIEPVFLRALRELNEALPSRHDAIMTVARAHAREIADGRIRPYEGAKVIWRELANLPDADPSLRVFIGAASEWEDLGTPPIEPKLLREVENLIVEEARKLTTD